MLPSVSRKRALGIVYGLAFIAATAGVSLFASASANAQQKGGSLTWVLQREDPTISPLNSTATGPALIGPKIFEGLLAYDDALNPAPELATSWKVAPDGLTYTFKLREGVKWQDGVPFTSADVKFSLDRIREAHPRGRVTFVNVAAVEAPDAQTVVLKLSKPAPYLLTAFAASESPMVPQHLFKDIAAAATPPDSALVGTGPFKFKEWARGDHIILERNPGYWDAGKPYLDQIVVRFVPDAAARAAGFETGELDLGGDGTIAASDLERVKTLPGIVVDEKRSAYEGTHRMIIFNMESEPLKNLKVRQAISHAVDRKAINNLIWFGLGVDSPTPISPSLVKYHNPEIKGYSYDVAAANKLLDEAGFAKGADGYRFKLRLSNNNAIDVRLSYLLQQQLRAVGIDSEIQVADRTAYLKRVYTDRDFDITTEALANAFDPTIGVQRVYWSKAIKPGVPFSNPGHYANPEVDTLLEAAAVEPDEAKRKQEFFQFQQVIHDDAASIDLIDPPSATVVRERVKGYFNGGNGLSHNFAGVHVE